MDARKDRAESSTAKFYTQAIGYITHEVGNMLGVSGGMLPRKIFNPMKNQFSCNMSSNSLSVIVTDCK